MARFFGKVGYSTVVDKGNGVWDEEIVEKSFVGDEIRISRRYESDDNRLLDSPVMSHSISIVADAYLLENFVDIKYVEWRGRKWKVNYVEVVRPRLTLNLGGIYNAP